MLYDSEVSSPFYKENSTSSSAINYKRGTGGDAYIFSDDVQNNILNANSNTLVVGTTINHIWNQEFDIGDSNFNDDNYKVRWVVVYGTSKTNAIVCYGLAPYIEFVSGECYLGANILQYSDVLRTLKYIEFQDNTKIIQLASNAFSNISALDTLIFPKNAEIITSNNVLLNLNSLKTLILPKLFNNNNASSAYGFRDLHSITNITFPKNFMSEIKHSGFLVGCYSLKTVSLPNIINISANGFLHQAYSLSSLVFNEGLSSISGGYCCSSCYSLKQIIFPTTLKSITSNYNFTSCYSLEYVELPSSLEVFSDTTPSTFGYTTYIKLFNNFNISGINFTGYVTKSVQWLKDLCGWLKDRTGETANTMIIGANNLTNLSALYCTYDPTTKEITGWVDSSTEGAISATDYITIVKNWTLS